MSIVADIAALESQIGQLLDQAALPTAESDQVRNLIVEALLDLLDRYSADELAEVDLPGVVAEVLDELYPEWTRTFQRQIAERLNDLVNLTATFYKEQGVDLAGLRELVGRSEAVQQLTTILDRGMKGINDTLRDATVETFKEAVAAGRINRSDIQDKIEKDAGTLTRHARTQTQAGLAAYNQLYRNGVAERAHLQHVYYYGPLQRNTRPFCRISRNRVYTLAQVAQMDNSMLPPVLVFRGGWRCIHSWLPVNPEWDPELRAAIVTEEHPVEVQLNDKRTIKVFADGPRVERLRKQIPLEGQGYQLFLDAQKSSDGFVAIHSSWLDTFNADRRSKAYKRAIRLRDLAQELAEAGHVVEMTKTQPGDLIVDGEAYYVTEK